MNYQILEQKGDKYLNELILFILIQLLTTIISTIKSITTVNSGKTVAAIVNAISYTFGAVVTKFITKQSIEIIIPVTFLSNLIGVYIGKLIMEKTKKERLWVFNATVKTIESDFVETDLLNHNIQYTILKAKNRRDFFTIFSNSKGESKLIEEILEKYESKYSIIESNN